MLNKRFRMVLLLGIMFTATACNGRFVKGSGDLITEARPASNFDRIALSGSGEVIVTQGGSESLSIETDDNVMKYIKTEVDNGTLKLGFEEGYYSISPSHLVFHVSVDDLAGLTISGSGDIESEKLDTSLLDVTVSGSGDIQITDLAASDVKATISGSGEVFLAGNVELQDLNISGSGKYFSGDVCSKTVKVTISGSGNVTICVLETLNSNISGSGSVNYYGQPSINSQSSGSGSLNNLGQK